MSTPNVSFFVPKAKDRFVSDEFLNYIRSLPCCICGKPSTPSHMKSTKFADGSDALAVPACLDHHVQSTRTSREILERAGIDIESLHRWLWSEFAERQNLYDSYCAMVLMLKPSDEAQSLFENFLIENNLGARSGRSKRKNRSTA
jgi:hypothetical protein